MEFYQPRKLLFKAWDKDNRLLVRLDVIECKRGELMKKNHILLQHTGLADKQGEPLYEMDIVLKDQRKYVILWGSDACCWMYVSMDQQKTEHRLTQGETVTMMRLCSYFESSQE